MVDKHPVLRTLDSGRSLQECNRRIKSANIEDSSVVAVLRGLFPGFPSLAWVVLRFGFLIW